MKNLIILIISFSYSCLMINSVEAQGNLVYQSPVEIEEISYYAGKTTIKLKNKTNEFLKVMLSLEIQTAETEVDSYTHEELILIDGKEKTIILEDTYICKASINILSTNKENLVGTEFGDGTWTIHNPNDLFFKRIYEEERTGNDSCKLIERNMVVVPRLLNPVFVTKEINQQIKNYNQLEFFSEGLDEVTIVFEYQDDDYEIFIDEMEDGIQTIDLEKALNTFGDSPQNKNLINIHFEFKSFQQAMPIKLKHFQFNKKTFPIMLRKNQKMEHKVYPNPTKGNLTIRTEKEGLYRFELYDSYRQVYVKILDIKDQREIVLPTLAPGSYTYKLSNGESESVNRLIVNP